MAALWPAALAYDNAAPHSRLPPLGWSSWVALGAGAATRAASPPSFDYCDEPSALLSIDAFFAVGLFAAGYRHFHLDDCWADAERTAEGELQPDRTRFPRGLRALVDYAHARGLSFGLYTCAGSLTCVGGRPGSKGRWEQDAATLAGWGVDVVKMDWCHTEGMAPEETYAKMSAALNATGRHIHFNLCEWGRDLPWEWGGAIAQSWRVAADHTPIWQSTRRAIEARSAIPPAAGGRPYAWNDMDMLQTGNYRQAAHANGQEGNMTATEYRTEFSLWAVLASPLIVTTPLLNCSSTDQIAHAFTPAACRPSITPLQREILLNTEVLAVNQDVTPAGRLLSNASAAALIYARNLSDGSVALALYNPTDAPAAASVAFSSLGWGGRAAAAARDLWRREDLGVGVGRWPPEGAVRLAPHATLLLRLTSRPEA
ncbi:hypothetical protein AB1Y20_007045 [Prymnesium parvum]|uniref:Alpha-galactosidase n=1 Tax=Prymnesium parvum TaxID=97485 RepID=A0AB34J248_PRYPA